MFEELSLAFYWRRPSILIAVSRSVWEQKIAAARLQAMLEKSGCIVVQLKSSSEQPSIAHQIPDQIQHDKAVYFIRNLDYEDGGERRTYRALNMYRELFIERRIKSVFWLTPREFASLPFLAPDFWAFRHRLIEFGKSRPGPLRIPWHSLALWYGDESSRPNAGETIPSLEKALDELPVNAESHSLRVRLLYELGHANWLDGQAGSSLQILASGLDLMKKHPLPEERPRYLNARAILHIYEGQTAKALEVFRRLLKSYRDESILRLNFGISLCAAGKNFDGIRQARMAARKEPAHSKYWNRLGYLYIAAGRAEDAL
ncbi:MAG: hypothetical protein AB1649_28410, partial [Chloroflexota bacterium]